MDLLNPNSYQKGGWILNMLRNELGDEDFHQTIRTYYQKYRLSNADTKDFQKVAEEVSGKDLQWFFDQWLFHRGHPKLNIESEVHENSLAMSISQRDLLFDIKLPIRVYFDNGTSLNELIEINDHQTRFKKMYKEQIERIEIDPDVELLYEEVK